MKTRFAPSPTGSLHIGGARTALFNYLWAARNGGAFLLRFEDTDRLRSSRESEVAILEDLAWLGLVHDGAVVRQSEREERHREILRALAERGRVYPCFCPPEGASGARRSPHRCACRFLSPAARREGERRAGGGFCWRFAVPEEEAFLRFRDRLRGEMRVRASSLEDFVVARSDGSCTYLFAVVVDDHDASVTHAIRGEEHLSNVPKQELIYRALGWSPPEWVHIPMILDERRHKLSKRSGAISIASYREAGWSPDAVVSYLATLSWAGAPADRLLSPDELAGSFDLDAVALVSPVHDRERMRHFGRLALARMPLPELYGALRGFFPADAGSTDADRLALIGELRPQCATVRELGEALRGLFAELPASCRGAPSFVRELACALSLYPGEAWTSSEIGVFLRKFQRARGLGGRDFFHALRLVLTGCDHGAPISLILACLGRERTERRLSRGT